jgi:hypothetical protein
MKPKLQGPSLARTPSKAPGGALELYSHGHFFLIFKNNIFFSARGEVLQKGVRQMLNKSTELFLWIL